MALVATSIKLKVIGGFIYDGAFAEQDVERAGRFKQKNSTQAWQYAVYSEDKEVILRGNVMEWLHGKALKK